jgi:hypothetical protein
VEVQRDVLIAFFGAFAGFSAFGVVIATFLASSNALPWLGAMWGGHGLHEAADEGSEAGFFTRNRRVILVWAVGGGIGLAALVSCTGLIISFIWLQESTAAHAATGGWAYDWTGILLIVEVVLITAITLLVTLSAAWFAVMQGPKTIEVYRQMQRAASEHVAAATSLQSTELGDV